VCYASPARTNGASGDREPKQTLFIERFKSAAISPNWANGRSCPVYQRITAITPGFASDLCPLISALLPLAPCSKGRPLLLSVGGRGRACGGWVVASYASPARTAVQRRRDALNKCLPSPSLIALFEDSYLVANMNRSGDERRLANGENGFALVNDHVPSL